MDFAYYKKLKGDEVMVFFSLLQAMRIIRFSHIGCRCAKRNLI